jgi:hypothetical protein
VFCWLLLFLFQTVLIGSRQVAFHRRMGIVAVVLLTVLVPLSYVVTVHMVRRGFDLIGDQGGKTDPLFGSIFNFVALVEFLVLAGGALIYSVARNSTSVSCCLPTSHSWEPPIAHFLGYFGVLSPFTVLGGLALFFLSAVTGDYLRARRVHPLTAALAILLFLFLPIQAIIGESAAWHHTRPNRAMTIPFVYTPNRVRDHRQHLACTLAP